MIFCKYDCNNYKLKILEPLSNKRARKQNGPQNMDSPVKHTILAIILEQRQTTPKIISHRKLKR